MSERSHRFLGINQWSGDNNTTLKRIFSNDLRRLAHLYDITIDIDMVISAVYVYVFYFLILSVRLFERYFVNLTYGYFEKK